MKVELIALHERLTALAMEPAPDPGSGWAALRALLPERRRPFWLRRRRWVIALATAALTGSVAYAAVDTTRRAEDGTDDRLNRIVEPHKPSSRDAEAESDPANVLLPNGGSGPEEEDGTPEQSRAGVGRERDEDEDELETDDDDHKDDEAEDESETDDPEVDDGDDAFEDVDRDDDRVRSELEVDEELDD